MRRGLSLADCEAHLHIRAKFLAAVEDDRDEDLPEPSYARIFARSYANFLGLDAEALVRELDRRTGNTAWREHEVVDATPIDADRLGRLNLFMETWSRSPRARIGRVAVTVGVAVAVLIWLGYRAESPPAPASITPVAVGPVNIAPTPQVPAASTRVAPVRPGAHPPPARRR